jgi:hypothetical protein
MVKRLPRSEGGWTYLEMIGSLAILVIILGAVSSAQTQDFRYLAESFDETTAERAAASRIETLLAGKAEPAEGSRTVEPDPRLEEALPGVRLVEVVRRTEPGLFSVEVRVLWRGAGGQEHAYSLTTLVAAGGKGR